MNYYQHTIKQPISLTGVGLHTGNAVNLTFQPAPPNFGYKFKRTDLPEQPIIKADADLVTDVKRGTTIEQRGVKVSTIEHVLAALVGLEIDNVLIEIDGQEMPIMDGSSKPFVDALLQAGIEQQTEKKVYFTITEPFYYYDAERDTEIIAIPADEYQITVMIDFNSPVLGKQHAAISHVNQFKDEIASSRTFCFLHELELLLQHNLVKGGDLSNAIVVVDRTIEQDELNRLAALFNKPSVEVRAEGYLNNLELRHQNEPARHKLLDVMGDLALIGMPLKARIIATKPGHESNVAFAQKLKAHIKKNKHLIDAPQYDINKPAIYDVNQIAKLIPHRFPFLLVDKIIELSDQHVVGVKNVTFNEEFFQGHFPGHPIMPGVLIIEAMAQTGGILLLNNMDNPQDYVTYFLMIDKARFRNPVVPGDTLIFKLELASPIRRGLCEMTAVAYAGNKIAAEASLTAQILKKQ
ncbi:MAG: bifunctional UDP-3-O-[3-hydroxymyristoyl] N-acetylglucosamine deacetylase/3-hydroxyacyl-ACP dehydratase [Chitinophagales bacterium]|jgi:UDP-3-O-[3-hydroxymyristoyl] N-acetylglucosamine deacetylase/3-hydroxyacyl-[acyl-carrier-protein] dehydratase|nr:bifunctional UDP-3-O-[3-hydroxymyristoyl] N-acetylglucosamine deacetylase/3-hydroxyacyl-ACP dehydratase [Chitinophagales bacterium]